MKDYCSRAGLRDQLAREIDDRQIFATFRPRSARFGPGRRHSGLLNYRQSHPE